MRKSTSTHIIQAQAYVIGSPGIWTEFENTVLSKNVMKYKQIII